MSLIFSGASSFAPSGVIKWIPSLWDLDQLIVPYRGKIDDLEALLESHPLGEISLIDSNMSLVQAIPDDHKQFPTVQFIFQGKRNGIAPPDLHEEDDDVMSASSKISSLGIFLTQPLTVEYYAPAEILTYYTFGGRGIRPAPTPTGDPRPITVTSFDQTFAVTGSTQVIIDQFFSNEVIATIKSVEVVPGRWWKNVARTNLKLSPFIFTVPSGPFITLWNPGVNYRAGDVLTINAGGQTAEITVTQVLTLWGQEGSGGVYKFTVGTNTFTVPHTGLLAYGGYGQGCGFNVAILP